jgi:hypothetical protein
MRIVIYQHVLARLYAVIMHVDGARPAILGQGRKNEEANSNCGCGRGRLLSGRTPGANRQDVTLVDGWPEHVETIRKHGLQLSA